ncbi:translation factor GTPase family protein [Ruminococcus flavefaciens]|uniref:translation factor GTPase family protein n=1 Tax=Ruminococcus flavefaciens TaxID=1265 RepID=UPI0026F2D436|nr:TetM/TetW/TetO/TetS family tetracycline resistance ribosomal protection protein [Ruminococcus flavefaciens]
MKRITVGITAHVDSGKTTLAEAMLYKSGSIRSLGRVDSGNTVLDTNSIEKERGITIFSAQAELFTKGSRITLLDTPGHVDFLAETERTMCVLDYAILVISGTDGVQSHTSTLWNMLRKYEVPVFIFVNKMDLIGADKSFVVNDLRSRLSQNIVDFTADYNDISENTALCDEEIMEKYVENGFVEKNDIIHALNERRVFPCFFGSALKMQGVEEFLSVIDEYTCEKTYRNEFSAKVYKISYDSKGSRLTHMKITGGCLKMRDELCYTDCDGNEQKSKVSSIRFYTGEKFRISDIAEAGDICALTGLVGTFAGQGIGSERSSSDVLFEPVMTYRVIYPKEKNAFDVLKELRLLEDEDPQLHICWNEQNKDIHIQIMGAVQLEVLTKLVFERFGYAVSFENGAVTYKETIRSSVEGVGHYEPLRHYAEAHILLEPMPRGSGIIFDTVCSEDELDRNWQRLILTHLEEKTHLGVLTDSPITDIKMTLVSGKAHLKHTEGGDFRQATYRAVRQGLRLAESILLEPYYDYEIELPTENVGKAISDLQHMCAEFEAPESLGEMSVIRGNAPVSEINDYRSDLIAYTHGKGRISFALSGYKECHNTEEVIEEIGYDCDRDTENSADSVFCSHGSGYVVKWNEVYEHMHLPLISNDAEDIDSNEQRNEKAARFIEKAVSDEELMAIFEMAYGKINRDPVRAFKKTKAASIEDKKVRLPQYEGPDYLLVDGYNIIFAWDDLKKIAEENLDAARAELIHRMCNYQGYIGSELILVFDAYKVKGKHRDIEKYCNINIVYTKESETADSYIEKVSHELSKKHRVRVATSDGLEQMIILGNGAMRISAAEFRKRVDAAESAIKEFIDAL